MNMPLSHYRMKKVARAFTLIELMVALGLFAVIMTIAAGSYLTMINANRHAQALAKGVDNLSFALEVMTRTISTGSHYDQIGTHELTFLNKDGVSVTYAVANNALRQTVGGVTAVLTDPSVTIGSSQLTFIITGKQSVNSDQEQARVQINVHGSVNVGPGSTKSFDIETLATMRGSDL